MPTTPASEGRATLTQSLSPWHVAPPRAQRQASGTQSTMDTPPNTRQPLRTEADNDTTPSASYLQP